MKKVLFLLLVTSISYGQALFDKGIKITGGITTANDATKVVVQSANNVLNTIAKNDLIDVVIVNTTAELTSGIGNVSKLYATRDNTIIYRYNGTIYVPLGGDISAKEDIANKSSSFTASSTVTYANTKALVDGLATKVTSTGTTNYIPKTTGTNTIGNSSLIDNAGNLGIGTNPAYRLDFGNNSSNTIHIGGDAIDSYITPNYWDTYGSNFSFSTHNDYNIIFNPQDLGKSIFSSGDVSVNAGNLTVAGTVSSGTTTAGNTPPTANNQLTRKDYVDTGLALKANLASPTFTGVPIVPTASNGTNTGQAASTAFVTGAITTADSGNVKLTGNQTIGGIKTINHNTNTDYINLTITPTTSSGGSPIRGTNSVNDAANTGTVNLIELTNNSNFNGGARITNNGGTGSYSLASTTTGAGIGIRSVVSGSGTAFFANAGISATGFNYVGQNNLTNTFTVDKLGNTTATSFINSTAPATNALLANGTTLANPISGTGTTGYLPKFTSAGVIGNSIVSESGSVLNVAGSGVFTSNVTAGSVMNINNPADNALLNLNTFGNSAFPQAQIKLSDDGNFGGNIIFSNKIPGGASNALVERVRISNTGDFRIINLAGTGTRTVVADASGNLSAVASVDSRPYKVYTALLNQSGTSAPVATVLENTLGGTVVWSRNTTGNYYGTLSGAFPNVNKLIFFTGGSMSGILPLEIIRMQRLNSDTVQIFTQQATDGALVDESLAQTSIEIRVYN